MTGKAVLYAVLGGVLWAIAPFGKRYGVEGTNEINRAALSACTFLMYALGMFSTVLISFLWMDAAKRRATFADAEWRGRVPWVLAGGFLNSLGGLAATYAYGLATPNSSALISIVENGVYCISAAVLIVWVFHEEPSLLHVASAMLILAGTLLAEVADRNRDDAASSGSPGTPSGAAKQEPKVRPPGHDIVVPSYGAVQEADAQTCREHCWSCSCPAVNAIPVAVVAGLLWACGVLGKAYGAKGAPEGFEDARSVCTFFLYTIGTLLTVTTSVLCGLAAGRIHVSTNLDWLRRRAPGVVLCGLLSGLGGEIATYAFAIADANDSSIISVVENGVYTLFGALLIVAAYEERPSFWQAGGALLLLTGVILVSLC